MYEDDIPEQGMNIPKKGTLHLPTDPPEKAILDGHEPFLRSLMGCRIKVEMNNGHIIEGVLLGSDKWSISVETKVPATPRARWAPMVIFKHAIGTMTPE